MAISAIGRMSLSKVRIGPNILMSDINISAFTYDNILFSLTPHDDYPTEAVFAPDGATLYVIGTTTNAVYQFSLSTPWDISTVSYTSKSFSVGGQDDGPSSLFFSPNGNKFFVTGTVNDQVYQYLCSTPWDISTAYYNNDSLNVAGQDGAMTGIFFKPDGYKMYTCGLNGDSIYEYTLSTAWDINSATYIQSKNISAQEGTPRSVYIDDGGIKAFIVGVDNDTVYQYTMSTPWDISTLTYDSNSLYIGNEETVPEGVVFKPDGSKLYIIGSDSDAIHQYSA